MQMLIIMQTQFNSCSQLRIHYSSCELIIESDRWSIRSNNQQLFINYNLIFLDLAAANLSIMSSKSVGSRVSLSILRIAKSTRRYCPIEARRYERISFNLLKERLQLAIETAIVSKICNAIHKFGKTSSPYDKINESKSSGVVGIGAPRDLSSI